MTASAPVQSLDFSTETQVGFLLRRAYHKFNANLGSRIAQRGLTPQQFGTLAKLREAGPVSQNQLGRMVAMDPAAIHGVVQRMVVRGLIMRQRSSSDRRIYLLTLSPEGKQLVEDLIPIARAAQEASLGTLDTEKITLLIDILGELLEESCPGDFVEGMPLTGGR